MSSIGEEFGMDETPPSGVTSCRRLSRATDRPGSRGQNPDIAIARPQGRSCPSIAREDGRKRPLGRVMDVRERAYGDIRATLTVPASGIGLVGVTSVAGCPKMEIQTEFDGSLVAQCNVHAGGARW